ncbi:cupin-like domain-containing protein [Altererythrobacter luteolus]|uniref:Cupin-like domain-containing protein n=1 Tax=Pontixanthobacter luteolus TaxID=295089 RepID=A0A6I4V2Z1_9SPHN|nr:cupin-like domain-containing protein [Pontixanthobacter luteolus]MXP48253.1 cupin-like domain-containing protein [Pontixanthobacter luteolus]
MNPVDEIPVCNADVFEAEFRPAFRPFVIRGLASDWPIAQAGKDDPAAALTMIERFDTGAPADIMVAPQSAKGRFFYGEDMRGFNFRREKASLADLARHLRQIAEDENSIGIYAGASDIAAHVPALAQENPLPLVKAMGAVPRIWLGNATQVATHFDLSDNFAVVAVGKRRFTLFPPDATPDLYVGPLNITLAGQPVSLVDPLAPDHDRFPKYRDAEEKALFADLEPGDAIYVPTLWWHHVAASAPINLLINYWHNDAQRGGGFLALVHAMLAIRDQPAPQRKAWRTWFDHFVFGEEAAGAADHIPTHARGVNGPASPERDEQMRRFILQVLSSP